MSALEQATSLAYNNVIGAATFVLAAADKDKGGAGSFSFTLNPDTSAPGLGGIQAATNVVASYALAACFIGFLVGALVAGGASWAGNDVAAQKGRTGMVWSLFAAALVGAGAILLTFAYGLGSK